MKKEEQNDYDEEAVERELQMATVTPKKYHPTGSCETYDYDEDEYNIRLYTRKQNALLYIHLHQELLAENKYKTVP